MKCCLNGMTKVFFVFVFNLILVYDDLLKVVN